MRRGYVIVWGIGLALVVAFSPSLVAAKKKAPVQHSTLQEYIQRARSSAVHEPSSNGSLWSPGSGFADLAGDYRARGVNDTILIRVSEVTSAVTDGSVKTDRKFQADSGIDSIAGQSIPQLASLFSPHSSRTLTGTGQSSSDTTVKAFLSGHVVEVLPNGDLVIEAERQLAVNNQRQRMFVRGIVRPGDIAPDNSVPSSAIANLELELEGKGVISDSVAPPNRIVRAILRILGF